MKIVVNTFVNLPPTIDLHPATREWVYFLEADLPEPIIKIGRASNLRTRVIAVQRSSPVQLKLIGAGNCPAGSEKLLHEAFAKSRLFSEWFSPTPDLLTFIKSLPKGGQVDFSVIRNMCKHAGMYENSVKKAFSSTMSHAGFKSDRMPEQIYDAVVAAYPKGWPRGRRWKKPRVTVSVE